MMTYRYCRLMISKLTFHERNPVFLGNLSIGEQNDIRRILNDNLDAYFQLCIELLDYMEELLGLVEVVFTSLDQSRANSMTAAGQCRLHPLILCIQDSSLLYDYIVKVLFKLHDSKEIFMGIWAERLFFFSFRFTWRDTSRTPTTFTRAISTIETFL